MTQTTPQTPDNGTQVDPKATLTPSENGTGTVPAQPNQGNEPTPNGADITKKEEVQTPPTVQVPSNPAPTEPDYKTKFAHSTRENQIITARLNEVTKVLGDITKQEIPSEDEMRAKVPGWDDLFDREKAIEMKMVVLERRQNQILNSFSNITRDVENERKLTQFITGEDRLKGREDQFRTFCEKPSHQGVPVEVLVNAFLFENPTTPPATPEPTPTPPTPESAPSLMSGGKGSGGEAPRNTGQYSDEELKDLRTKDPKKYHDLIRTGKI
jgi:hypothetical protein